MNQETTNKLPLNTVNKSPKPGKATEFFNQHGFWPEHDPQRAASLGWREPIPADLLKFVMFG